MTEPMASEPAEPTTRQDERDLIEAGRVICDAYKRYAPVPAVLRSEAPNIARALADLGLLADPAQTTELERLRGQLETLLDELAQAQEINNGWQAYKHRKVKERRKAESERDALSLLLRGMARKLVAYRKWADGDVPTVHKLRAELDGAHLTLDTMAGRLNQARAEREERQARIDRAMVEIAAWWGTTQRADRVLMAVKSILSDLNLAALVGDQPPAEATLECPHCRSLIRPASGAITQLDVDTHLAACGPARQFAHECATAALSGVALRDVEEADDAAGDLP